MKTQIIAKEYQNKSLIRPHHFSPPEETTAVVESRHIVRPGHSGLLPPDVLGIAPNLCALKRRKKKSNIIT